MLSAVACQLWSRPNIPAQSWGPCREPGAPRPSTIASSVFKTGYKLEQALWLSFQACMCRATGRLKLQLVRLATRWTPRASASLFPHMLLLRVQMKILIFFFFLLLGCSGLQQLGVTVQNTQRQWRVNSLGHSLCGRFLFPHWVFVRRWWDITLACLLKQHLIIIQSSKEF